MRCAAPLVEAKPRAAARVAEVDIYIDAYISLSLSYVYICNYVM